jgi:hypothetical protein
MAMTTSANGAINYAGALKVVSTTSPGEAWCQINDTSGQPKTSYSTVNVHGEVRACGAMAMVCVKAWNGFAGSCGVVALRTYAGGDPIVVSASVLPTHPSDFGYLYVRYEPRTNCAGDGRSLLYGYFAY